MPPAEPPTLARTVREIADDWLTRAIDRAHQPLRAPHRQPCRACTNSPLLASLGDFAGWPHMLVHPLLMRLRDVIEGAARAGLEEKRDDIRERYLYRVDVDEDFVLPDDDALLWAAVEFRHDIEVYQQLEAEVIAVGYSDAAEVLGRYCSSHALIARDVITVLVERAVETIAALAPGSTMDEDETQALHDALNAAVAEWTIWLPTRQWKRVPVLPQLRVCAVCSELGLLERLDAPHGAMHTLATGVLQVLTHHVEVYNDPRAEPPASRGGGAFEADVRRAFTRWLDATSEILGQSLRLYVLDEVDEDLSSQAEYLYVVSEHDDPVAPGDAPD